MNEMRDDKILEIIRRLRERQEIQSDYGVELAIEAIEDLHQRVIKAREATQPEIPKPTIASRFTAHMAANEGMPKRLRDAAHLAGLELTLEVEKTGGFWDCKHEYVRGEVSGEREAVHRFLADLKTWIGKVSAELKARKATS